MYKKLWLVYFDVNDIQNKIFNSNNNQNEYLDEGIFLTI